MSHVLPVFHLNGSRKGCLSALRCDPLTDWLHVQSESLAKAFLYPVIDSYIDTGDFISLLDPGSGELYGTYQPLLLLGERLQTNQVEGLILAGQHMAGYDTSHELFKVLAHNCRQLVCRLTLLATSSTYQETYFMLVRLFSSSLHNSPMSWQS